MKKIFLVILTIVVFIFTTCDDGKKESDPCDCLATYGTTAHLGIDETCTCGGKDCECTEQTAEIGGISIRKVSAVTVQQMNTAFANINTAYGYLDTTEEGQLAGKITEIHITSGATMTKSGTVLKIGHEADKEDILDYLLVVIMN